MDTIEEIDLLNWMLNHWEELMNPEQYENWYYNELSKYESQKEWYESFN